ncbi:ZmpA/ZmpB/ZmpC family metallo-endopeptidase [Paraclostridium sordellii]|uniref:ZmpA/ZmpB/ZmpC family metallo-endopeptidase n=1 Tax=Paraclostridium sordellii TaxID=1505 RepID=UPI0005DE2C1C|nr:ZmpA/ZmpB/ZmpC family metallo-endopeptidase [Paeniclostridium sordellii]CEO06776.1 S-layer-like domain-containing protein [[Clostridium] sordellii] [Paeniclostridium sordellii]CEP86667.1 S-layer-like domain-containing protein [[Clostridium] sordellii] [Paeniclostridium sordellii]CEP99618.1 S-layer-like domain-containing protein [[Clostridium] sordellii] [Paeniclostridium sordellii]
MKNKKVSAIVSSMIIGMTGTVSSLPNTVYAEETPDTVIEKNLDQEVKNKKQTEDAQVEEKSIQRGENKYKLDHIYRNNNANGKEVSKQVKEPLQSVKYEKNDVVANLLAPNRFSGVDKLNKKQEIAKRDNISITNVTDAQVEKELKEDNVHVMSYGQSFLDTQKEIEHIIQKLVENSTIEQGYTGDPNQYFIDKITKNKEKLLLGIAYIDRLYDFNIGNKNIKEILTYTPNYYGKQINPLDWLIRIGGSGGEMLKVSNNLKAFANLFKGVVTDKDSLLSFLEDNKNRFEPNIKMEEWFKKASKAIIVEQPSQSNPNATTNLYSKLSSEIGLQAHILPLLTVSENSIYVITNSATITYGLVDSYIDRSLKESNNTLYQEKINQFKQQLEKAAKQQHDFIEFWYRLGKPKVHSLLSTNRLVIDSLRLYNSQTTNPSKEWSPKFGDGAAMGVKEFITPLNLYANYFMADGQAEGSQVRLFLAKALDERGLCTYTHELTHLLVGTVWLNNNKQREGLEAEFYPRGLFETYELDEPVLNLNLIYDHNGKERFHNSSPERFKTDKDLQEYTSGLFDVLYTLDYAEANVILKKDKDDKQKWFHKLEQINDTRKRFNQGNPKATHKIDSIRKISTDEANELNTIYDLIDKNIITSRYEVEGLKTTGNVPSNGYYVIPLFSSNYAGVQNNNGVSGDVMMRRQAYELIAEYGYYDGLVPYLSNQYKAQADKDGKVLSDEYILGKIFEGKYATMTDFKKAMFNKRIDKKEQLKPVSIIWKNQKVTIDNFNKLNELMTDAIESDLKNVQELPTGWNNIRAQNTQVELLKKEIFKAYLKETDDFNKSIYRNDHKIIKHNKYINGYPDNTFRQENKITRGEIATMLSRIILDGKQVPITENKFNDISNDYWAKNEVNYLASKGLFNGYEDGTFRPENPITRAEVATILVRSNGDIKQKFKKVFPDIDDSHWASKYIEKAAELGYMLGYEDGSFKPDQVITRGETVVTLNRIYRNPCDLKETNNSKILFTDLDKNNWAYNDIVKAILSHEHVEK